MANYGTQLRLDLLGPPEVHLGDRLLTFPTRKTLALLIYLALESGQQPRELLAAVLWPESSTERSYASLRNTLSHLQAALRLSGEQALSPYLSISHHALALNPDADIQLDMDSVERAYSLARADRSSRTTAKDTASLPVLVRAAARNRGDFLAGFSLGDAPGFDDWAVIQREAWRRRMGLILDRLSEIQFARGDFDATVETASSWIALDGLNEVAYRRMMRAHFAAGERGQALKAYDACRAILASELGVQPEPDTTALAELIRASHTIQPTAVRRKPPDTPVVFLENLFAGRTIEHQTLVEHYRTAAAGQPQVVVLRGELGIGKTRLARAFMAWAIEQGADALEGRAFESGSRLSYQPLIEAFRPLLEREDTLLGLLGETWLAPLSHLLPEMRKRFPELPSSFLEVDGGRTQLFEALVSLTLALEERSPLVLFIDDLQWADSATLDWLVYAARRWQESDARILLLVGLRSEDLQPSPRFQMPGLIDWLAHIRREVEPVDLKLGSLSEKETVEMMLTILAPPAADFAQWIYNETRGQPFYLMETLKDLLERRALHPKRRAEGDWVFEIDAEHDLGKSVRVPSTVRSVVLARLARLSPNAFVLLVAGAILEQRLTFERLCAVSNIPQDAGLPALDELVSGRLLLELEQGGFASTFLFSHHMIRDVVYTEAGDARRRLFHQRTLEVLETSGDSAAVLAHHALAAGLAEKAFQYSLAAGREALSLSAVSEAIAHLENARQLAKDELFPGGKTKSVIHDLYTQLGQAYYLNGNLEQAAEVSAELKQVGP